MQVYTFRSALFGIILTLFSSLSFADVLIKAERHPEGRLQSTNFTVYNDAILVYTINGREGSLYFPAGTQLAMPWNSTYRFAQSTVISYDQRKLYEVSAGMVLTTPEYVPEVEVSSPPREEADEVHCVKYQYGRYETHCLVKTDKEDDEDGDLSSKGAYTSVNVSVKGNGRGTAFAKVEGCNAVASSSAVVIGSGSAKSEAIARAWGCD